MRVAINTSPLFSGHKNRGMGQYTRQLIDALKKTKQLEIIEFTNIKEISKVDLVHYPYFDLFFNTLPIKKRFPTVVTIPDVTPLLFPQHYPAGIKGAISKRLQMLSLKNVAAVVTLSNHSKKDICKVLKIEGRKVFPIYLAAADIFKVRDKKKLSKVEKKYNLPQDFVLYVGSVNWNKNLLNLTEASLGSGKSLVIVGRDFENKDNLNHPELKSYKQFLKKYSKNTNVHILGYVGDDDLVSIYNLALCLMLPSYYEGFGLPILEAQTCGCPVITSITSSMPEVAGKGALFVNPNSVESIVKGIKGVDVFRERLVKNGFENSKKFSWDKCARETVKVYQYALKN